MRFLLLALMGVTLTALVAETYHQYGLNIASACNKQLCEAEQANGVALAIRPQNRRYLEAAATLSIRKGQPDVAIRFYQQLLVDRPAWPFYWAQIVGLLLSENLIQKDQKIFNLAWTRMLNTGPFEYQLQHKVLSDALPKWYSLSIGQREDVISLLSKHCHYRLRPTQRLERYAKSPRVKALVREVCLASAK